MNTNAVDGGRSRLRALTHVRGHLTRWRRIGLAVAASALGVAALAGPAAAAMTPADASANYSFTTLDNANDPTFNQLLGINDFGVIGGYFGSGQTGHPNKGYVLRPPYSQAAYRNENVTGSVQTQVTGLNNGNVTFGFWVDGKGNQRGFWASHGHHFNTVVFPTNMNANPIVDQLLGVNDSDVAVGFYTDKNGTNHGYTYNILRHGFHPVAIAGYTNLTASGINNLGDVVGFADNAQQKTVSFLRRSDGKLIALDVPGADATQALGVNNGDEVVGVYTVGTGNDAKMHGFTWAPGFGFQTVNDPNGADTTTINGLNDRGDLVGFYVDGNGNTDGLLARP